MHWPCWCCCFCSRFSRCSTIANCHSCMNQPCNVCCRVLVASCARMGFLHCCFHDRLERLLGLLRRRFHELVLCFVLIMFFAFVRVRSRTSQIRHMAFSSFHLFAQRRSETLHISGQYLDAGVNLRSMPAFFDAVLRATAAERWIVCTLHQICE